MVEHCEAFEEFLYFQKVQKDGRRKFIHMCVHYSWNFLF
jgi:hypothetical protein